VVSQPYGCNPEKHLSLLPQFLKGSLNPLCVVRWHFQRRDHLSDNVILFHWTIISI